MKDQAIDVKVSQAHYRIIDGGHLFKLTPCEFLNSILSEQDITQFHVMSIFRYLDMALDTSVVRKQDASSVIIYISQNTIGKDLAWSFVRRNYDRLKKE